MPTFSPTIAFCAITATLFFDRIVHVLACHAVCATGFPTDNRVVHANAPRGKAGGAP
jgi:hypothetical protein